MGIPITPEPDPFRDDCEKCFDPGKTPEILHVVFSGVLRGDLWDDTFHSPPDGHYVLTQEDGKPCNWKFRGGIWNIDFTPDQIVWPMERSLLQAWTNDPIFVLGFRRLYVDSCIFQFSHGKQTPAFNHYWAGAGWILSITE